MMKKHIVLLLLIVITLPLLADYGSAILHDGGEYEMATYTKVELEQPWGVREWIVHIAWTAFFIGLLVYIGRDIYNWLTNKD